MQRKTQAPSQSRAMTNAALDYRRLLLLGILLPVALAAIDQAILQLGDLARLPPWAIAAIFAFYVLQLAVISLAAAAISPWYLRWAVFGWAMLLVDLQLVAAQNPDTTAHGEGVACLAASIFAAQLGVFVVWGVLADERFVWRGLSLVVLTYVAGSFFLLLLRISQTVWGRTYLSWNDLVLVQGVVLMLLCGALRAAGFRLARVAQVDAAAAAGDAAHRHMQFGIRDLLVGTTVLAGLLGLAKSLSQNLRRSPGDPGASEVEEC